MNKIAIYLFLIAALLIKTTSPARADTDYIVYAFNMVGVYTGIAQEAINKVSQYSRMVTSAKTMVGGYLGDKVQAVQEKVELAQEKVENAQEKVEKVKERAEWAKEKKEALMAKYNELNSKLSEYKEKATKAIEKGKEIRDKYKTYVDKAMEYKDKALEYKDKALEYKDKAMEYKNDALGAINDVKNLKEDISEGIDSVKNTATDKLNKVKEKTGISSNNTEEIAEDDQASYEDNNPVIESDLSVPPIESNKDISAERSDQSLKTTSNQADAIMSAKSIVEQGITTDPAIENIEMVEQAIPSLPQNEVSLEDIADAAGSITSSDKKEEATSELNLEDQLTASATKSEMKKIKKDDKVQLKNTQMSSSRGKFEKTTERNDLSSDMNDIKQKKELKNNELPEKKGAD